ncbi:hypothetical protein ACPA54_21290 [Uniformispora flossi]|uniref:hypothetical protein n=1 Tax=Uniformispora flossi TaxID=3390723 RepID=UPI003C2ADB32
MSEDVGPLDAAWPLAPPDAVVWLRELCDDDGVTGFLAPPMPDAAWVLNAMYEHERGPGTVSYDERKQAALADGTMRPQMIGDIDFTAIGVATGGSLGRARHPGPGWRRLRWAELARRIGDPVVSDGMLPCPGCFPSVKKNGSWPVGIIPPAEGSLDRETWLGLIDVLATHSAAGLDTRCLAFHNPLVCQDFDNVHVRTGRLRDAAALYDDSEADFSPSNLWPEDRSWLLCTDYDLWGTKVVGSPALIEALLNDDELEALHLE